MTFATWILVLMTAIRTQYREAEAPWADTYRETADGIAVKCEGAPMPGGGKDWCAGLLVEMSWKESRFNPSATHDGGAGFGLFGMQSATLGRKVPEDVEGQVQAAIDLLQISFRICAKHPLDERLSWYMMGGIGCERRNEMSRFRTHEVARLLRSNPFVSGAVSEP
jgi:hypothetical protein